MTTRRFKAYSLAGWVSLPFISLHLLDGFLKPALASGGPLIMFWAFDFATWVLLSAALLAMLHHLTAISPRDYGLSSELGLGDILSVLLLPLLSLFFIHHFTQGFALAYWPTSPQQHFNYQSVLSPLGPAWIVGTVYLAITAGFCESIFWIGLPWLWFKRDGEVTASRRLMFALLSATGFAVGHWENGMANVVSGFTFQILAVWWYFRLGTLWPVIGAHFLIDMYYFWPAPRI